MKINMILIDADGCPVVELTIKLAKKYGVPCLIVHDTSHEFYSDYAQVLVVDKGADSVDYRIVNKVNPGDIVITQDYGLAAMCLSRKGIPLSQNGLIYDDDNIGALLNSRHFSAKIRRSGGRLKGPTKRKEEDNLKFTKTLEDLLRKD